MSKYRTLLTNLLLVAALSLVIACSEDSTPQPSEVPPDAAAEAPAAGVVEAAPPAAEQATPTAAPAQAQEADNPIVPRLSGTHRDLSWRSSHTIGRCRGSNA